MMEEDSVPRVLVVEASTADLYIIDYYLYPHFEVYAAETGEEALMLLKKMVFDCVMVDADLSDCKSGDLIESIQTHFGPVPVVLLTGISRTIGHFVTPINGVSTCVNKDMITNDQLLKTLWEVLEHSPVLCSMIDPKN